MSRYHAFCFTINNYTYEDMQLMMMAGNQRYLIFGFEIGDENGLPHIQGYVYYDNAITWTSFKKKMPRANYRVANGTADQNYTYVTKQGDFYEFGTKPVQGLCRWEQIESVMANPKENPKVYAQYKKYYKDIRDSDKKKLDTKFYVIDPIHDAITEVYEYFSWGENDRVAVVTDLSQLEAYEDYDHVIYYCDYMDRLHLLWPRKVPITYKYGYEIKTVNVHTFVIVTNTPRLYQLYKNIK